MKTLFLISNSRKTIDEIRTFLEDDWLVWDGESPDKVLKIFPSLSVDMGMDMGIVEMESLGSPESWGAKLRTLPNAFPWIGIFPQDIAPEEIERFAVHFRDILCRPFSPFQIRWALQKGRGPSERPETPPALRPGIGFPEAVVSQEGDGEVLDRTLSFARSLTAGADLDQFLDLFLEAVRDTLGVNRVSVLLLQEDGRNYRVAASRGLHPDIVKHFRLRGEEGMALWMTVKGRILSRERLGELREESLAATIAREMSVLGCAVSVPLMIQGRMIGVLNLDDKVTGIPYAPREMAWAFSLAGHAAAAIEHIRTARFSPEPVHEPGEEEGRPEATSRIRQEMIGQFAHELRNPLVAVYTFTQLLKDRYEDPELREFFYTTVSGEVDRLNQLVERLSAFVQPIEYRFVDGEIRDLLEELLVEISSRGEGRGFRVVKEFPRETCLVRIDRKEMTRALGNVLRNAVRGMEGGGILTVRVASLPERIRITMEDTGSGIPPEDLERVFDPFRVAAEGEGMGLPLSRKIIEEHGGTVRVESRLNRGTIVIMELPKAHVFRGGLHVREKEHSGRG